MIEPGFYHGDCMAYLTEMPDKAVDLAIVDPPYGIGCMSMNYTRSGAIKTKGRAAAVRRDYRKPTQWDIKPGAQYFKELERVAVKLIVWGGNYFSDMLPPSKSFIVWDKRCNDNMTNDFADCEIAWASENVGVARVFRFVWNGMLQGDMKHKEDRIHPTQKPVELYKWVLNNYAKPGDLILDTHVGSGSSLVACREMGFKYIGFEIDEDYYREAKKRVDAAEAQVNIFDFMDNKKG